MSNIGSIFGIGSNASKEERKQAFIQTIQQQHNLEHARMLIQSINENCYEKCVPKPGSSLARAEDDCVKNCAMKYMAAWNVVSQSLVGRIKEGGL
ncbi:mitochondrial intermembrane space translocase subunit Tim13 [Ascodesmis nigricans]|uniref:Mitochondrial import inner membrane translocase subunit n=1 Tax=Ascodesmis nigricans TaxID=341454 RepID=A0A4S2MIG7_9PEZI|nr:mitochondrial intermembrane space translocase subunit Tim13 [Ascodesmis nigricans]